MITTVLLDVDNTLLDFNRCAAWAMKKAMTEWGLPCHEQLYHHFQIVNQQLWHEIEEGEKPIVSSRYSIVIAAA
ncbi:MAG: hypothetical protein ACI4BB_11840, partial [Coprococcus sp.]